MNNDKTLHLKGGQQHASIRNKIRNFIKEGTSLYDLNNFVEKSIKKATKFDPKNPLNAGIAFPVGISINNVAAHWAVAPKCDQNISTNDLITIDFGLHHQGYITDSAFTMSLSNKYDELMNINREAVYAGIAASGPDAKLSDVGKAIGEVLNNAEVEIDGTLTPVQVITSLSGHQILPYRIHGSKAVPNYDFPSYTARMKEGEVYAIEPFVTTGSGKLQESLECNHYMLNYMEPSNQSRSQHLGSREHNLLKQIKRDYDCLCFNSNWIGKEYRVPLSRLAKQKIINRYPMLYDVKGTFVSQFEHNVYINQSSVTVLTKGNDW